MSSPPPSPLTVTGTVEATSHPLVASYSISVSLPAQVHVEFGPDAAHTRRTNAVAAMPGTPVTILVAGMKPSSTYQLQAIAETADGMASDAVHSFTTGSVNPAIVTPAVVSSVPASGHGIELLDMTVPNGVLRAEVLDLDGSLLWYYDYDPALSYPWPVKLLPNGHFLLTIGTGRIREVDLTGQIVREVTPADVNAALGASSPMQITSFHHDVLQLPNGHLMAIAEQQRTVPVNGVPTNIRGDVLVDLDENLKPVWEWSAFDHLDPSRHPLDTVDWTHANAVLYSPNDGNLLLSMRNQNWILKIDYANARGTGAVLWRLGPGGDFALSGTANDWFYAQHFPAFIDSNTSGVIHLGLMDNRATDELGLTCATDTSTCYSRAVELSLDEANRTASILWEDRLGLYSAWGGNFTHFSTDTVEVDLSNPFPGLGSRVLEIDHNSKQVVWQMDIQQQLAYRAIRIPSLYPGVQW